ncbi:hypothetical protein AAMO2058_000437600 [Amorphochlora amoebiformis]|uniref:Rhodanese domain-containing protein n=1 Tax=Amorphochlora amoebiformis TaxID=1561963 RepID=A0A7S0H3Y7_9EUKA|mmetsp:Transcript_27304/g.43337  ORF Transcript_27304/g.43337 Transcript_27304/m.43337 type:complete len:183 (+) Transcript_27304:40-588(+)
MASRIKSIAWSILAASVAAQSRGVRGSVSLGSRLATRWFGSTYTRKFPSVAPRPRASRVFSVGGGVVPKVDKVYVEKLSQDIEKGNSDEYLIDVREPYELQFGSIPGAVNIPLSEFVDALDQDDLFWHRNYGVPKVKLDDDVTVYCKSGKRSLQAASYAVAKGYPNWKNYEGSYIDWFGKAY